MESNITGRDAFVVAKALYWAIKYQTSLPQEDQEWSDTQDIKAILLAKYPGFAQMLIQRDEAAGVPPADLVDEKGDTFSDDPWN